MTLITYSQEELVKDVKGQAKRTHLHKQISTKEKKLLIITEFFNERNVLFKKGLNNL